jgi:hypothetical protein
MSTQNDKSGINQPRFSCGEKTSGGRFSPGEKGVNWQPQEFRARLDAPIQRPSFDLDFSRGEKSECLMPLRLRFLTWREMNTFSWGG